MSIEKPCQMSVSEMRYEVMQSVKDAQKGFGITLSEARRRQPKFTLYTLHI